MEHEVPDGRDFADLSFSEMNALWECAKKVEQQEHDPA